MINGKQTYDVGIIGGGLAGLASSILLARQGFRVVVFEKKCYPFHRVCGEYISEESRPFLQHLGVRLEQLSLPEIRKLKVSSPDGSLLETALTPGGFGISRYRLDAMLAELARSAGVFLREGSKVESVSYMDGVMQVSIQRQSLEMPVVIGCFGKRSNIDLHWKRPFALAKTGKLNNYVGIKYHIRIDEPADTIALHNFKDGYCGLSAIDDGMFCLCYLTTAQNLGLSNNSIEQMETEVVLKNPHLEKIFKRAEMIWKTPQSISQVSFMSKSQVEDHVLLVGDAAGTISPLCGNGMSMALHASKLVAAQVSSFLLQQISRTEMERQYRKNWQEQFSRRLYAGRILQNFFGAPVLSKILVKTANGIPALTHFLVRQTHGDQF